MKILKALSLIGLFLICSCEKSYNCTITTNGLENPYVYEFKGTHKEMKEFENSANTYVGQTIECK